jgi:UDP-galactopyranose mutase
MSSISIITFSHLRWNSVYQRPQHLMARLARRYSITFIEEPVLDPSWTGWEISVPAPNISVYTPHTPFPPRGFTDEQLAALQNLLDGLVASLDRYVAWLYTPMALPLAETLHSEALVYDCMDELSLFLGAPRELVDRETALLQRADLVFTGGPSLFKAKQATRPDVHCFPSSVDAPHFKQAAMGQALPAIAEAADQIDLPHPRLGFFGVIDERVDLGLLSYLADTHKGWQIVLVGPVVKIDPSILPRRPNLHYLGKRTYAELPAYLAGWDVCLLPFALNDATRFISPTKTLEYMAAERPIVSTPIQDVLEPYGDIVYIGSPPEGFCKACEDALRASVSERKQRRNRMQKVIAGTSWDGTAQKMEQLLLKAIENNAKQPQFAERMPQAS